MLNVWEDLHLIAVYLVFVSNLAQKRLCAFCFLHIKVETVWKLYLGVIMHNQI